MGILSPELRTWLVPGLASVIASVDPNGQPQIARVWALRARAQGDVLELYVQRAAALRVLEGLGRVASRAALNAIEVATYRARMFKGACELSSDEIDAAFFDASLAALERAFLSVGMPPGSAERMLSQGDAPRSMVRLDLTVDAVFDQSPKPGAGGRL